MDRPSPLRIAALALVALAACAGVKDLLAQAFERPRLTFESVSAEALDLEGVTLALRYRVDNPNAVGVSLARLGYSLDVEGRRVVAGDLPAGVRIPARGSAPLVVPVRLRYADVPACVETLLSKSSVAYEVKGTAGLDTPVGVVDLPFQHAGTAPVPRPPGFDIESARLVAGAGGLGVDLRVRVTNRNAFPIPAGRLEYALDVGGATVASGATHLVAALPAGGSAVLLLPARLDAAGAGRAAAQAFGGGPLDVKLRGTAGYGSLALPLDLRGAAR